MAGGELHRGGRLHPLQLRQEVRRPRADQLRLVRRGHVPAAGGVPAEDRGQGGQLRRQELVHQGALHTLLIH